jgi:hypothetical protein
MLYKLIKLFYINFILPVHIPPLFHAKELQTHVSNGFLKAESKPLHPMQVVALVHSVQLLLQA